MTFFEGFGNILTAPRDHRHDQDQNGKDKHHLAVPWEILDHLYLIQETHMQMNTERSLTQVS